MSLDVGFMRNIRNNSYNKTMKRYLMLQAPGKYLVNGKVESYIPSTPYLTTSKTGKPTKHLPCPEWAPYESEFRKSVYPTSTAFERIVYNPMMKSLNYKFRNGSKTYSRPMSRDLWNDFITSSSLGKYYNNTLKIHGRLAIRKGKLKKWDASTKKPKLVNA